MIQVTFEAKDLNALATELKNFLSSLKRSAYVQREQRKGNVAGSGECPECGQFKERLKAHMRYCGTGKLPAGALRVGRA